MPDRAATEREENVARYTQTNKEHELLGDSARHLENFSWLLDNIADRRKLSSLLHTMKEEHFKILQQTFEEAAGE